MVQNFVKLPCPEVVFPENRLFEHFWTLWTHNLQIRWVMSNNFGFRASLIHWGPFYTLSFPIMWKLEGNPKSGLTKPSALWICNGKRNVILIMYVLLVISASKFSMCFCKYCLIWERDMYTNTIFSINVCFCVSAFFYGCFCAT